MNLSETQKTFGQGGSYVNGVAVKPATAQESFSTGGSSWGPRMDGSPIIGIDG